MRIIGHTGHEIFFNIGKKFWQLSQKSFQEHQDLEYADDIPKIRKSVKIVGKLYVQKCSYQEMLQYVCAYIKGCNRGAVALLFCDLTS